MAKTKFKVNTVIAARKYIQWRGDLNAWVVQVKHSSLDKGFYRRFGIATHGSRQKAYEAARLARDEFLESVGRLDFLNDVATPPEKVVNSTGRLGITGLYRTVEKPRPGIKTSIKWTARLPNKKEKRFTAGPKNNYDEREACLLALRELVAGWGYVTQTKPKVELPVNLEAEGIPVLHHWRGDTEPTIPEQSVITSISPLQVRPMAKTKPRSLIQIMRELMADKKPRSVEDIIEALGVEPEKIKQNVYHMAKSVDGCVKDGEGKNAIFSFTKVPQDLANLGEFTPPTPAELARINKGGKRKSKGKRAPMKASTPRASTTAESTTGIKRAKVEMSGRGKRILELMAMMTDEIKLFVSEMEADRQEFATISKAMEKLLGK